MLKSLRYGIVVVFTFIAVLCCMATPAWGFIYENPAEAAFTQTRFELVLPYIAFQGQNNLFTIDQLQLDLNQRRAREDLLARLDGKDLSADFATELRTGLTIGRLSMQLRPFITGSARTDYGLPKLLLLEGEGAGGRYDLAGSELNALAGTSFDFTYGYPFPLTAHSQLGVGLTVRYVQGYALAKAEVTKGTVIFHADMDQWKETEVDMEYRFLYTEQLDGEAPNSVGELIETLFAQPAGSGVLVDVGVIYDYDRLRAGLVLKNIGRIKWRNLRQVSYKVNDVIKEDDGDISEGEALFKEEKTETRLAEYDLSLPLVLQAQGSYQLRNNLYWHLGMEKGLSDGWGVSSKPCFQTGLEWCPRFLRLAGNLSYHDGSLGYDGLVELRLFFFWLNLHLGWVGEGDGVYASAMTALHF